MRVLRARRLQTGLLILAASFSFAPAARGQFPIRQVPARWNGPQSLVPAGQSSATATPAATTTPHPAIARITVPEKDGISYGSGTLIDARGRFGLVVTNWHVVRDAAGPITVEFAEGFKTQAQVVRTDKDWDLAALSIFRPQAQPLPITSVPPQPGEVLTIAGYGGGDYRVAGGRCTQYLAPSNELPYEMVELAAEARQGDSGGPILNQRGEICGVLFGSGPGYTSGSYGGRVRQFLAAVVPGGEPGSDAAPPANNLAAQPPLAPPANRLPGDPAWSARSEIGPPRIDVPPPPQTTALHQTKESPPYLNHSAEKPEAELTPAGSTPAKGDGALALVEIPGSPVDPKVAIEDRVAALPSRMHTSLPDRPLGAGGKRVDVNEAPPDQLLAAAWKKLGGTSLLDQTKSILAIIGVLAVALRLWRLGSRGERDADDD